MKMLYAVTVMLLLAGTVAFGQPFNFNIDITGEYGMAKNITFQVGIEERLPFTLLKPGSASVPSLTTEAAMLDFVTTSLLNTRFKAAEQAWDKMYWAKTSRSNASERALLVGALIKISRGDYPAAIELLSEDSVLQSDGARSVRLMLNTYCYDDDRLLKEDIAYFLADRRRFSDPVVRMSIINACSVLDGIDALFGAKLDAAVKEAGTMAENVTFAYKVLIDYRKSGKLNAKGPK